MLNKLIIITPDTEEPQKLQETYTGNLADEVTVFDRCDAAFEYLKREKPELIIFDINMPVDFNCLFLHEFSQLDMSIRQQCKIIAVTDRNNEEKLKTLPLLDEIIAYEAKPVPLHRLEEIIESL